MKKLTLSMFLTIEDMNTAKEKMYKEEFAKVAEANPEHAEVHELISQINSKTMSHFISLEEMKKVKVSMYEKFIKENSLINWD